MEGHRQLGMDLTQGPIASKLIRFTLPFLLASLLQTAYSTVDMVVVGQYVGSVGSVAVSQGSRLTQIFTSLAMGFASAGQVFIGQQTGAKDHKGVNKTIGNLFTLLFSISVVCLLFGSLLGGQIVQWMKTPAEAIGQSRSYLIICSLGMPFIFGYNAVCAVLRGMGDSKRPLLFVAIASVINLVLDLLFVAVFKMGAAGAAWATIIGQGVSFLVAVVHLYRRRESFGFDFRAKSFKLEAFYTKTIVRLGIPMSMQFVIIGLTQIVITALVNDYGLAAAAAWGVGERIFQLVNAVDMSLQQAGAAMIAQNMGANEIQRVKKVTHCLLIFSLILAAINTVWMLPCSEPLFRLFNQDPEVVAYAPEMVIVLCISLFLGAIMGSVQSVTTGTGAAGLAFVAGILDSVVFRFGFCFLFGYAMNLGMIGFYMGTNFARVGPILVCGIYYLSGKWQTRRLVQKAN